MNEEHNSTTLEQLDNILMHSLVRDINSRIIETSRERNLDAVEVARTVIRLLDELPSSDRVSKIRNIIWSSWVTETSNDHAK